MIFNKKVILSGVRIFCITLMISPFFSYSYNLAPFLHFSMKGEFDGPLVMKDALRINYFKGWENIPGLANVAVKPVAIYRFFTFGDRDIKILLDMEKYKNFPGALELDILINDFLLTKITLEDCKRISLLIPRKRSVKGMNYLKFKVSGGLPVFKRKKYNENKLKLFILRDIKFVNFPINAKQYMKIEEKDKRFFQPANTSFSIAVNTAEDICVKYDFLLSGDSSAGDVLSIESDAENEPVKLLSRISVKKGVTDQTINLKDLNRNKIFRLTFRFGSKNPDNFLIWKKVEIKQAEAKRNSERSINSAEKHPHIIFIVLDAARADLVGKKVSGVEVTPNMNKFFETSTNFTNFFTSSPFTATSMATFFSGMFPEVHNLGTPPFVLPDNIRLISDHLRKKMYKSYVASGNPVILNMGLSERFDKAVSLRPDIAGLRENSDTSYNDEKKLKKLIRKIDFSTPVFLYIHLLPPHYPYKPPEKRFQKFSPSKLKLLNISSGFNDFYEEFLESSYLNYLDNANYSDYLTGEILKLLRAKNCYDNSVVIVASDHGEAFGEHNFIMHGFTNYIEMIKIPFSIKFPGQVRKKTINRIYSNVDFLPSVISWMGIGRGRDFQGQEDMFLNGDSDNSPDNRFLYSSAINLFINSAIFNKEKKYIFNSGYEELYYPNSDPKEVRNMIEKKPFVALYLKRILLDIVNENRLLKNVHNIKKKKGKISEGFKKELKALGYL